MNKSAVKEVKSLLLPGNRTLFEEDIVLVCKDRRSGRDRTQPPSVATDK